MQLTSYGAAGTVTGSCHLIEMDGQRLLIDCGMFQGTPEEEALNAEPLGFDPRSLDAVLLTHAHLDHCGRLPLLVQGGYSGPIFATRPTYDAVRLILVDSARVQYEDWANRREAAGHEAKPPLYSEQDVYETLDLFAPVRYNEPTRVSGRVQATYRNAGHVLGSAFIEVQGPSGRVTASGDVGVWGQDVVPEPTLPGPADIVIMESTYGGKTHQPLPQAIAQLRDRIQQTIKGGGNVLIPTFALERAQDMLYILRTLHEQGQLPPAQTYLDSPLAINFTRLHRHYPEQLGQPVKDVILAGGDPFSWPGLTATRTQAESRAIDDASGGHIIMAGSGMATAGRIVYHLARNLPRPESSVIFVGFQAEGTLGRQLVDGATEVEIGGEMIPVRAHIECIDGFSAHADQPMLLRWVKPSQARRVFLVHGEDPAPQILQAALKSELGLDATISARGETYTL